MEASWRTIRHRSRDVLLWLVERLMPCRSAGAAAGDLAEVHGALLPLLWCALRVACGAMMSRLRLTFRFSWSVCDAAILVLAFSEGAVSVSELIMIGAGLITLVLRDIYRSSAYRNYRTAAGDAAGAGMILIVLAAIVGAVAPQLAPAGNSVLRATAAGSMMLFTIRILRASRHPSAPAGRDAAACGTPNLATGQHLWDVCALWIAMVAGHCVTRPDASAALFAIGTVTALAIGIVHASWPPAYLAVRTDGMAPGARALAEGVLFSLLTMPVCVAILSGYAELPVAADLHAWTKAAGLGGMVFFTARCSCRHLEGQ